MNIQPSVAPNFLEHRQLFGWELAYGGTGQLPMSAATYTTTNREVIYSFDFLEDTTITSVGFRSHDSAGNQIYNINSSAFVNWEFPAGSTWTAPVTSITFSTGKAIGYKYTVNPMVETVF